MKISILLAFLSLLLLNMHQCSQTENSTQQAEIGLSQESTQTQDDTNGIILFKSVIFFLQLIF